MGGGLPFPFALPCCGEARTEEVSKRRVVRSPMRDELGFILKRCESVLLNKR